MLLANNDHNDADNFVSETKLETIQNYTNKNQFKQYHFIIRPVLVTWGHMSRTLVLLI